MGVWQWKTAVYEHMLIAQARIAHEIARRLLKPGQYERVNIPLEHPYPLDDFRTARTLIEPGAQAARTRFPVSGNASFSPRNAGAGAQGCRHGRRPEGPGRAGLASPRDLTLGA